MAFSGLPASHLLGSCAQGLPGQGGGIVWWRGWPGGGPSIQCSAFPSSAFFSRAPSPDQYRLPLLRIPSLLSLPASLPLACLPPSLPPSLISSPPAPRPSAGGQRAGGRAGRRRPRRGEGEVVAAGSGGSRQQRGRPIWGPGASGCSSQGTRSPWPGPPTKALHRAPPGHPTLLRPPLPPAPFHSLLLGPLPPPHLSTSPAPFSALRVSQHPILPSPSTLRPLPAPSMFFPRGLRA